MFFSSKLGSQNKLAAVQRSSRDPKARVRAVVHVIPFRAKYHYKVSHVFKSSNFRHRRVSLSLHRCNGNRSRSTSVLLSVTRTRLSRPVPDASQSFAYLKEKRIASCLDFPAKVFVTTVMASIVPYSLVLFSKPLNFPLR